MFFYIGTSGYSYKEWKGLFYPKGLPDKQMLQFYGENLPSVEINNTFHRMPTARLLENWAEQVPADFRFVLKASAKITHRRPLKDKADEIEYFFKTSAILGDKLGAILFQLPPYLHKNMELLTDFINLLPLGIKVAFEFRHKSWFDDELYDLLHNKKCAICFSDENPEYSRFVPTTDWGYFRFRKEYYSEDELVDWAERINSEDWSEVFAFFKHEDSVTGPQLAKQFLEIALNAQLVGKSFPMEGKPPELSLDRPCEALTCK